VRNRLIQGLAKAAPGVHELVLLGKIYYELRNFDRVVVDLPSTGHGLAMFHATQNFAQLFRTGKAREDADKMLSVFRDPAQCGFVLVSLPEEMPLQETLELDQALRGLFPDNPGSFICNRLFPRSDGWEAEGDPDSWTSPLARDAGDYCRKRARLEHVNLELWRARGHVYAELPYFPPPIEGPHAALVEDLSSRLGVWAKEARA
jgi:anion-transporting  ArsA/GET3 family ATPase